jgi:hypothetical protein
MKLLKRRGGGNKLGGVNLIKVYYIYVDIAMKSHYANKIKLKKCKSKTKSHLGPCEIRNQGINL